LPGETEEYHENVSRYSRSPGIDLNPVPPKYEAGSDLKVLVAFVKEFLFREGKFSTTIE
jgi:hypothetical protein